MSKIIKEFQLQNGLVADGTIGKKTATKMMDVFGIPTKEQISNFLGQTDHETGSFETSIENLNYSPNRLRAVFGKYFPSIATANQYGNHPQMIGNRVYANRMGNGDESSGDGYRYRGAGALQLTGKTNYQVFTAWLKKTGLWKSADLSLTAEIVAEVYFWETAAFYFTVNGIWNQAKYIDDNAIKAITKKINGGFNGLQDRAEKTKYYYKLLN